MFLPVVEGGLHAAPRVALQQSEGWERLMTALGHVIERGLLPGEALFPAAGTP